MNPQRTVSPLFLLLLALIVGVIGGMIGAYCYGKLFVPSPGGEGTLISPLAGRTVVRVQTEQDAIVNAVAKTEAAVVKIETISISRPRNMWEALIGPQPRPGLGSGFVFSYENRPFILTNSHVVASTEQIAVELMDGRRFEGKLIGAEIASDLAVVELVDAPGDLKALELGDSDKIRVGEWVIAMGNPFGYTGTVTVGVVSAKGYRPVGPDRQRDVIQTDAAINRGNSGGPLLNLAGQAIGVNFSIFTPNQEATTIGIGFAIPINEAKLMVHFLIHGGPWIGIGDITPNSAGFARYANLATDQGVWVASVVRGSAAERAGLRPNDVILSIDGAKISNAEELRAAILKRKIGDELQIIINRDGTEKTLKVVAGRMPRR